MIELVNVSKIYGNNHVIRDMSYVFKKGSSTKIVGDNGSGKSVLLKLIAGYARPTSGEIYINGKLLKRDLEFVEDAGLFINSPEFLDHLTGMENLMFLADFRKIADEASILELAKRLRFDEDIFKKYKTFSLGMKQKMRLIQAFMDKPSILLLDEPMDNLDKSSKVVVAELLNEFTSDENNTLIFVSHNDEDSIKTTDYLTIEN